MTVKEAMKKATDAQMARLRHSFEQRMSDYVVIDGWWLGVHMNEVPTMLPIHVAGRWSTGKI